MMQYKEVKALIKDTCNLTDIIVDNLMLETTLTRKVTIGLTDESDAAIVFKELNGLVLGGRKIIVEDLRKNKDPNSRFQPQMGQDPSMIQAPYTISYQQYPPNMGLVQSANANFGLPPKFGNVLQQQSAPAAPDFIPFADKSKKAFYEQDSNELYYNWKPDSTSAPPRNDMSSGGRMPSRNNAFESRDRSSFSTDRRFGDWQSNQFSRRSGSGERRSDIASGPRDRDDRYRSGPESSSRRGDYERRYDRPRSPHDSRGRYESLSRFERDNGRNVSAGPPGANYARQGRKDRPEPPVRNYPKQNQSRFEPKQPYKSQNQAPFRDNFKPARGPAKQPWSQPTPPPKLKDKSAEAMKNKDETWRGQAASALVKDMLTDNGMEDCVKKQCLLTYVKPIVRTRIDEMLGKRKAVPLPLIIEEYKKRHSPALQRAFIIDVRKKYEWAKVVSGEITKDEYEARVAEFDITNRGFKRPANVPLQGIPRPNKKAKIPQTPGALPNADAPKKSPFAQRQEEKRLKRLGKFHTTAESLDMNDKMKNALDKEVEALCNIFRAECQKAESDYDKNICSRMLETLDEFSRIMRLNLAKRVMHITYEYLPMKAYTEERLNSTQVKTELNHLGVVAFKKCIGKNKYIAKCMTYDQYDYLCAQEYLLVDGKRVAFRPLHMGGAPLKKLREKERLAQEQQQSGDNDEEDYFDGDEEVGDEEDYEEEDDEMYEEGDEENGDDEPSDQIDDGTVQDESVTEDKESANANLESKSDGDVAAAQEQAETNDVIVNRAEVKAENDKANVVTEKTESVFCFGVRAKTENDDIKAVESSKVNEMNNAETVKLFQDIKALSESISNDGIDEQVDQLLDADEKKDLHGQDQLIDDMAFDDNNPEHAISQDDLEDF